MPLNQVLPWLLLAVLTGACASSGPVERPVPPPPPILFKSPLAVLLERHEELRLSTDQMIAVGKLDGALQEKNKPLRLKLWELQRQVARRAARPAPSGPPIMDDPPPGVSPRGWGGRRQRQPWNGMGPPPPEVPPESDEAHQQRMREREALLREMEAHTSAAYTEAEKVLDETQRARAGELVARHREEQQRAREAMSEPAPAPEK